MATAEKNHNKPPHVLGSMCTHTQPHLLPYPQLRYSFKRSYNDLH